MDFIALVNAKWNDKEVTVEDASQYSGERIHLVFENGRVKELDPATTKVFLGGG
ncbi:hypothetical protein MYX77_01750 [Acidobacteriia bacterium AH_259_A11_L15]|nr:hypothetical protein [Acidobacteriia bacterium AH_259_A11_L15]